MGSGGDGVEPAAAGVNSARGWSRVVRAWAVVAVGVLGAAALLFFAVAGPGWSGSGWFEDWGFVAGLLLVPLVVVGALVVLSVRLRVAPVGAVSPALLGLWGLVPPPGPARDAVWWGAGLVLAPVVAALVTHPRPWGRQPGRAAPDQVSSTAR